MENKGSLTPYLIIIFITLIVLIIQSSLLTFLIVGRIIPDLLLVMVVCLAFLWGEKRAAVVGLLAGLMQDIFFGPALGFFCLAKMLAALIASLASKEIYRDQILGPMLIAFFATFVHELVISAMSAFFWGKGINFVMALEKLFLPKAVYHFVLTMLVYPLFYRAELKKFFYPSFK